MKEKTNSRIVVVSSGLIICIERERLWTFDLICSETSRRQTLTFCPVFGGYTDFTVSPVIYNIIILFVVRGRRVDGDCVGAICRPFVKH